MVVGDLFSSAGPVAAFPPKAALAVSLVINVLMASSMVASGWLSRHFFTRVNTSAKSRLPK